MEVGGNPATPVDSRVALARDEISKVRFFVGRNPATPVDVLRALATDKDEYVRRSVGQNAALGVATIEAVSAGDAHANDLMHTAAAAARRFQAPNLELPDT